MNFLTMLCLTLAMAVTAGSTVIVANLAGTFLQMPVAISVPVIWVAACAIFIHRRFRGLTF